MMPKLCIFVFLAFYFLAQPTVAEECVARSVIDLTVDVNHVLSWAVREDEPCEITEFIVYIYQHGNSHEYYYSVTETYRNVSFLEVCEEWTFIVEPVSGYTKGIDRRLVAYLPLPIHADLNLSSLNVTGDQETGDVHMRWSLVFNHYGSCSLQYRVTVSEDGSAHIDDIYVSEMFIDLHFLSPCSRYQFTVRAINVGHPTVEGPVRLAILELPAIRQGPPTLIAAYPGTTEVTTTWRLQSVARNACRVTEFTVQGTNFNSTVLIVDSDPRPDVNVTLESLNSDNLYLIRAYTYNTAGDSDPATAGVQTLKEDP